MKGPRPGIIESNWYREATISIPHNRLKEILHKGDIILGWGGYMTSANYVGYRVTHIDWWGVYAVPTDEMLRGMGPRYKRRHFKFKWQHITGIKFLSVEELAGYE